MKYKKEKGRSPNHDGRSTSPVMSPSSSNSSPRSRRVSHGRTTDATVERLLSHSAFVHNQYAVQNLAQSSRPQYAQQWNTSPSYTNQYLPQYASSDIPIEGIVHSSYVPQMSASSYYLDNNNYTSVIEDTPKNITYQPYVKKEPATVEQLFDNRNDFNYNPSVTISWDNCSPNNLTAL